MDKSKPHLIVLILAALLIEAHPFGDLGLSLPDDQQPHLPLESIDVESSIVFKEIGDMAGATSFGHLRFLMPNREIAELVLEYQFLKFVVTTAFDKPVTDHPYDKDRYRVEVEAVRKRFGGPKNLQHLKTRLDHIFEQADAKMEFILSRWDNLEKVFTTRLGHRMRRVAPILPAFIAGSLFGVVGGGFGIGAMFSAGGMTDEERLFIVDSLDNITSDVFRIQTQFNQSLAHMHSIHQTIRDVSMDVKVEFINNEVTSKVNLYIGLVSVKIDAIERLLHGELTPELINSTLAINALNTL